MQLGLFSWYGYKTPLQQRLERVRQAGFTSTMLWWGDNGLPDPQISKNLLAKVADLGLTIENIHVKYKDMNCLWSDDDHVRREYLSQHLEYIEFCAKHHLPMMVMHISQKNEIKNPNPHGIELIKKITEEAEALGVVIAIENTRRVNLVEALLDAIDNNNLGLCYDTSHGRLYEPSEFHLLNKYPHRLKCLHISDNDGLEDKHWNPYEGVIDWNRFIKCFPSQGQCKILALETSPKNPNESEADFLRTAYESASKLLEGMQKRTS